MADADDFRRIALSFAGAEELAHMGHPDFRVNGRIFATLGGPDPAYGMVALMPAQQADFMTLAPDAFRPAAGAWGRRGSTLVRLDRLGEDLLEAALVAAWRRRVPSEAPRA
ncbi:MAG TPA: MmcQ/YjbR family DNA-binding protein [Allosphingosinicella sp.]|jgi:hypothetical protein